MRFVYNSKSCGDNDRRLSLLNYERDGNYDSTHYLGVLVEFTLEGHLPVYLPTNVGSLAKISLDETPPSIIHK